MPDATDRASEHVSSARSWPAIAIGLGIALAVAAAACGADSADDSAPPAAASEGATLYNANCASCHGSDLRGTALGPSHLSIVYEPGHHPDDSFRAAISDGVTPHHWPFGAMPPVIGLDDDEIDAIIAYIREVQQREGFEPYPPD